MTPPKNAVLRTPENTIGLAIPLPLVSQVLMLPFNEAIKQPDLVNDY